MTRTPAAPPAAEARPRVVVTQAERQARGSAAPIQGRCCAKLIKTKPPRYCTRYPLHGRTRCRTHGGRTPLGPASPHFKRGEHSQWMGRYQGVLPGGPLLQGYQATLQDTNLRTLREQIALATALEQETVQRLATGESHGGWLRARELMAQADLALQAKDQTRLNAAWRSLRGLLLEGGSQAEVREELQRLADLQRRLRETESKLQEREGRMLSQEQVLAMARLLAELCLEFLRDRKQRQDFAHRVRELAAGYKGMAVDVTPPPPAQAARA